MIILRLVMQVRLLPSGALAAALLLADCAAVNLTPASSPDGAPAAPDSALPTISGTPVTAVQVGATYTFRPTVTNSGRSAKFSIQNPPPWTQFSAKSGALTGTPSTADIGTYPGIVITVRHGSSTASVPAFSIAVISTPTMATAGAPLVLYTDLISGPNSGGENNKGAYLSIFGKNFGSSGLGTTVKVSIGGVEDDNYRYLGPSKVRTDIQQTTVQVGALGNPPPGTGAIVVMGYPTEDAYIRGTLAGGQGGGCISAINGESFPDMGQWAVISNLRIDCEGYDGPISQEIYGNHWRVVNNDLAASTAPTSGSSVPRMAGITGNGTGSVWLGNHIHDIQGSPQECHGIYVDGDGSYEIAYNLIENIRSGNGFQIYVNGGNGSNVANNVNFHHNLIHDVSKHGINLADNTQNGIVVFDNVVYNVQYAGIRFNTTLLSGAKIYNNTFYATNLSGNPDYGLLTNDLVLPPGAASLENNIFWPANNMAYTGGVAGLAVLIGTASNNIFYGGSR